MRVVLSATLAVGMIPSMAFAEAGAPPSQNDAGEEVNEQVSDQGAQAPSAVDEAANAADVQGAQESSAAGSVAAETQGDVAAQSDSDVVERSTDLGCGKYSVNATAYAMGSPVVLTSRDIHWSYSEPTFPYYMTLDEDYVIAGYKDAWGGELDGAPSEAGVYTVVLQGIGGYTGKVECALTVKDGYDLSSCSNNGSPVQGSSIAGSYDALDPLLSVWSPGEQRTLQQGVDYRFDFYIGYSIGVAPSEPGTYDAELRGLGKYHGSLPVKITLREKCDLTSAEVHFYQASYQWTGSPIDVYPSVYVGYTNLQRDKDYELKFFDANGEFVSGAPVEPGSYSVKLVSLEDGRCVGETGFYDITIDSPYDLSGGSYYLSVAVTWENVQRSYYPGSYSEREQYFYTGKPITPSVTEVRFQKWTGSGDYRKTFEYGSDYAVYYIDSEGNEVIPAELGDYKLVVEACEDSQLVGKMEIPFSIVETKDLSNISHGMPSLEGTQFGYSSSRGQDGTLEYRINDFLSDAKELGFVFRDNIGRLIEGLDYVVRAVSDGMQRYFTIDGLGKYAGTVRATVYGKDAAEAFNAASFRINESISYAYQLHGKVCLDSNGVIQTPLMTSYQLDYGTDYEYVGCYDAQGNQIAKASEGDTIYVKVNGLGDYDGLSRMIGVSTVVDSAPYDVAGGKSNFIVRDAVYSDNTGLNYLLKSSVTSVGLRVYRTNMVLADGNGVSISQTIDNSTNTMTVTATGDEAWGYTGQTSKKYQLVDKLDLAKTCSYVRVSRPVEASNGITITEGTFPTITMKYAGYPFKPNICLGSNVFSGTNCQPTYQTSFIDSSGNGSGYITGPGTYEVLFAGIGDYEGMITGYINVTDDDQVQLSNCDMKVNGQYGNEYTLSKSEAKGMTVSLEYGGTQLTEGSDYSVSYETSDDGSVMRITATAEDDSSFAGTKSVVVHVVDAFDINDCLLCVEDPFGTIEVNGKRYSSVYQSFGVAVGDTPEFALIRQGVYYPLWATPVNEVIDPANYDLQLGDITKPGTSWVRVTGKNEYTGAKSTSFNVVGATLPDPVVSVSTNLVKLNDFATLSAAVENAPEDQVAYEWQGSADEGKTWFVSGCAGQGTSQLKVLANAGNAATMKFRCKITVAGNEYFSDAIGLSVLDELTAAIAASAPVEGLSPLTVEVEGAGEAGLSYLWQGSADGGRTWFSSGCAGQGTATLKVAANKANAEGMVFRCVVTASDGRTATTEPASISLGEPLTAAIAASAPVEGLSPLTVEVEGAGEAGLSYLWQGSADGGRTWFSSGCAGQGTATLKVAANKANAEGMVFRCVVTASDGRTATTEPASILLS